MFKEVKRIIYIGDVLYTISNNSIKANNLNTMNPLGTLKITNK